MKFISILEKNIAFLIVLMIILGFIKGFWFPIEKVGIYGTIALFLMIVPVFINLEFERELKQIVNYKSFLTYVLIFNFLIYPAVSLCIGFIFLHNEPYLLFGILLLSLIPTSAMTINWTYFTNGETTASILAVISNILVICLLLPFMIPFLSHHILLIDTGDFNSFLIVKKLILVIIIPLIIGYLMRKIIVKYKGEEFFTSIKPLNTIVSAIGILIISFLAMSLRTTQLIFNNLNMLVCMLLPLLLFYIIVFCNSHCLGRKIFNLKKAKAFFFSTASKYHVITLGIVLSLFNDSENLGLLIILISLAQVIQIPALAFYARYINFIEPENNLA